MQENAILTRSNKIYRIYTKNSILSTPAPMHLSLSDMLSFTSSYICNNNPLMHCYRLTEMHNVQLFIIYFIVRELRDYKFFLYFIVYPTLCVMHLPTQPE